MREIVDSFFRERSIVNHHLASFNDFLPTTGQSELSDATDRRRVAGQRGHRRARRHPPRRPEDEEFDLRPRRPAARPPDRPDLPDRRADDLRRPAVRQGTRRLEADAHPDGGPPPQPHLPGPDPSERHRRRERRRARPRAGPHRRPADHGQEPPVQPEPREHRAGLRLPALGRGVPGEARRVRRGPPRPGRVRHHRRHRAGHHQPRGPRAEPDLRRVQRAVRDPHRVREGVQPAGRLPVAHRRREEEGRDPPGLGPHRLRPDPTRGPDEGPRDEERRGDLPGGPRRTAPDRRAVRPDDEAPPQRQPRGVHVEEALPPRGDPHDRGRPPLPREEVRHRAGEGVPATEGRRDPRPFAPPPPRRHEGRPAEEGPLPRADGPYRPRAPPQGPGRGRQGPLREQAAQARRRPHGGPVPGRVHTPPEGPEVPARAVVRAEEGPPDRERDPAGPPDAAARPRARHGELGRRPGRREPGARPDQPHVDDLPPPARHESADAQPAPLRGARPAPHAVGAALPQRNPRGAELRPRQELRPLRRRLGRGRRGRGHPDPSRPQHPRDRPRGVPGRAPRRGSGPPGSTSTGT